MDRGRIPATQRADCRLDGSNIHRSLTRTVIVTSAVPPSCSRSSSSALGFRSCPLRSNTRNMRWEIEGCTS
jgi:hypothetical protein